MKIGFCALLLIGVVGCGSTPHPEPATTIPPEAQMSPSAIIDLWTNTPISQVAAGSSIEERGHDGLHDRLVHGIDHPTLRVFLPAHPDAGHTACLICPGGGYAVLAMDLEGDDIARALNQRGIAAFVLIYRLPDGTPPASGTLPVPVQDVQRAIRTVRANASPSNGNPPTWDINPDRIGIMGFSAGGHLASTAATQFDSGDASSNDPISRQSSRPDYAVLMYPVISLHDPIAHVGSRNNLLGKNPSSELMDRFSADQNITAQTPPLLLIHAEDDNVVDVRNSLHMADAAARAHIPCELVLLKNGGHGFGLGKTPESKLWPALCMDWIERLDQK